MNPKLRPLLFAGLACWPLFACGNHDVSFPADFDREALRANLHPAHPRLFLKADDWQRLKDRLPSSPHLSSARAAVAHAADEMLAAAPSERVMTGRRLLFVSRTVLKRVLTLAMTHRLTGDARYFERARTEMLAAAEFADWNPTHFLDTAEMTLALAVGYDWLHAELSETDRRTIRTAIVEKGLKPGLGPPTGHLYWKQRDNNWPQVCFAGMVAGALAVAEYEPEIAVEFLRETAGNILRPMDAYNPHGAYQEGPGYWSYGTHFNVILFSVLESALGTTWNLENHPAFRESAAYINLVLGPSGRYFNYADGSDRLGSMPALHWFAAKSRNPVLDTGERKRLLTADEGPLIDGRGSSDRFFPLVLAWLDPTLDSPAPGTGLPLHWRADGPNPIAVHRSGWDRDALFFAMKGGSPSVAHGHMDVGSFVLDWKGVRWATDLGAENYTAIEARGMALFNRSQNSDRWLILRNNNLGHNTLVFDGRHQRVDGSAEIVTFSGEVGAAFTVVDMSGVYRDAAGGAVRGGRMIGDHTVLIDDELSGLESVQAIRWGMVTEAEVDLRGARAILRQAGHTLHAHLLEPDAARFEIIPTDPPPNEFDSPNPGTRMLAFFAPGGAPALRLRVAISDRELSATEISRLRALPPPTRW